MLLNGQVSNLLYRHALRLTSSLQLLSQPGAFKTIHLHTDVRLVLGWGSVIVSALTGLYGYKNDFETAKPVVWAGVILYVESPTRTPRHSN